MTSPVLPTTSGNPNLEAERLHSFLISCPDDNIVAACRSVEGFLMNQSPEAALGFFRMCFPVLLQKVFGFHECSQQQPSSAWLVKATDEASLSALRSLLHPTGPLFDAILAIDRENAIQFVFPNERLPLRVRRLLLLDRGASLLSQTSELFKNCIKVSTVGALQLQLDLFEYYMFWFAYYAACFNDNVPVSGSPTVKKAKTSPRKSIGIGQWVTAGFHSPLKHHHGTSQLNASRYSLYVQLLHLYVSHFVQPHHYAGSIHVPGTSQLSRGGFLLLTLVEFWLMKDDTWPLPASQLGALRINYAPPGSELCEAVRLMINHCNHFMRVGLLEQCTLYDAGTPRVVPFNRMSTPQRFPPSPIFSPRAGLINAGMPLDNKLLQKPLYRFISHAFNNWPTGISIKQVRSLVNVWLDYIQPWNAYFECVPGTTSESKIPDQVSRGYSALWQEYVTNNYPFYTTLVVNFLDLGLKSVNMNLEVVLEITARMLAVLAGSRELLEFVKKLDGMYNNIPARVDTGSTAEMDWEDSTSVGDFHAPQERTSTRLFGSGESGAFQAFQMLILQAEVESQYASADTQKSISKAIEYLKEIGSRVFDCHLQSNPMLFHPQCETFSPTESESRALGRHSCLDVKYRGDWMRRPIESSEIAWLARFLVNLSDSINCKLGLDRYNEDDMDAKSSSQGPPQMDVYPPEVKELNVIDLLKASRNGTMSVHDFMKEMKTILWRFWIPLGVHLRRQGWRVNLRCLAQKPVVIFFFLLLLWVIKRL